MDYIPLLVGLLLGAAIGFGAPSIIAFIRGLIS